MSEQREWGLFYFENRTKIPLSWSIKGLHVSVKKTKKKKNSNSKKIQKVGN